MIYIKNTKEIQTIFIPRTELEKDSYVVSVKSYDKGVEDGKELQKSKLTSLTVSENGVYKREDGWNEVEVDVKTGATVKTQQKTLYVTKNTDVVLPDAGYDALTKVVVNATQYGQDKRNEGYQSGYDKGKLDAGNEGYNEGYTNGVAAQKNKLTNLSVTTNGTYNREDGWNKVVVSVPSTTFKTQQKNITLTKDIETVTPSTGYDGLTKVGIDATFYVKTKRDEGYAEGHLQGKTEGIEEGYNQGYADGKAEGGAINLVELDETPKFGDGENDIIEYKPSNYNADGFSNVKINVTSVYHSGYTNGNTEGYNQGYNAGYEEGKSDVEDVELIEISDTPKMTQVNSSNNLVYTPSKYSADGFSKVSINVTNIYGEGYNEGYDDGKKEVVKINLKNEGVKLSNCSFTVVPEWADFSGITDMANMFKECSNLTVIPSIDTSLVTRMDMTFENCIGITTIPQLNTSKVTSMFHTFYKCTRLKSIPQLNTSEVTDMSGMLRDCTNLTSIPALNASNVTIIDNFLGSFSLSKLTDVGGLTDLKASMDNDYGFVKAPNLTYQSCINILNGLYDFVGNGKTPSSSQGKLKVHQNFLDLVGNKISIATNKGWTITA